MRIDTAPLTAPVARTGEHDALSHPSHAAEPGSQTVSAFRQSPHR